jgi:hypothetical protein
VNVVLGLAIVAVLFFVLVAGLIVLWRGGPGYLAAWEQFVSTVLHGSREHLRSTRRCETKADEK